MRRRARANIDIFNMSFLDVVSCGFGAIILLLVMVKIAEPQVVEKISADLSGVIEQRNGELADLRAERIATTEQLTARNSDLAQARERLQRLRSTLASLETGSWQGPVASGYGLHLVYIIDRTEARLPPLAEIRDSVLYELLAERRQQANQAFIEALRERYQIIVEQVQPSTSLSATESAQ